MPTTMEILLLFWMTGLWCTDLTQGHRQISVRKRESATLQVLSNDLNRTKRGTDTDIRIQNYNIVQSQSQGSTSTSHEIEAGTLNTQLITQNPFSPQQPDIASGSSEQESEGDTHLKTIQEYSEEDKSTETEEDSTMDSDWISSAIGPTAFPKITGNFSFGGQMPTKHSNTSICFMVIIVPFVWTFLGFNILF